MKPLAGSLALWLALTSAALAGSLRIASYNVENYVAADRLTDRGYRRDYPKPAGEKQTLREVIIGMNADVLIMQEMGSEPYLRELQRDLARSGCDYPYAVLLNGADAERHLAVLSRVKAADIRQHPDIRFKYSGQDLPVKRGLLEVVLSTPGGMVTLWAVHLKSRYTDRKDDPESRLRRGGEATAIRNFILQRFPDPAQARFLILGDFNDVKRSAAVRYLSQRGDLAIARLLPTVDSRGEAWTYFYRHEDRYERVDYILASPGLWPWVQSGAAQIYDGPGVERASDHRPVLVTLAFRGQEPPQNIEAIRQNNEATKAAKSH